MRSLRHISLMVTAMLVFTTSVMAKHSLKKHFLKDFSIGFYRGATILDVSKGGGSSTGYTRESVYANTTGITAGFPIINQFRAEVGLSMSNVLLNNRNRSTGLSLRKNDLVSVPVSVQYYVLPKKFKVQPYFGFGAMIVPDAQKYMFYKDGDGIKMMQGTSTISMLITQGVNIEINTKIHLTESLHVISSEGKTNFGLNFGVTLYVP